MRQDNLATMTVQSITADSQAFRKDVLEGLDQTRKTLDCKYLYDERGSTLFDQICELDEYYPTRTEMEILEMFIEDISICLGSQCLLLEYGSGSSRKIRVLLDHLIEPAGYVPIDISKEHLDRSATELALDYPELNVLPVCADFTQAFELPSPLPHARRRIVFFPGSTLGNFSPANAESLLQRTAEVCGPGGGLLLGVDLKKDRRILENAYNDGEGVTAAFNLNLLDRINRELDGDFDLDQFEHQAVFNHDDSRIEMHLVSTEPQTVHVGDTAFSFEEGETILSECSYKRSPEEFRELAARAGFAEGRMWTDPRKLFSVWYLTVE